MYADIVKNNKKNLDSQSRTVIILKQCYFLRNQTKPTVTRHSPSENQCVFVSTGNLKSTENERKSVRTY